MNAFTAKSIFLWQSSTVGDPAEIVALLKGAGFESAILHGHTFASFKNLHSLALVGALKAAGLGVIGSCAVYGVDPVSEGAAAAYLRQEYKLDGFVFDAEAAFESKPQANTNAVKLLQAYKRIDPLSKLGWCSWARFWKPTPLYNAWHPVDVMRAAMEYCDYGLPMMYWTDGPTSADAVRIMDQSTPQWRKYTDKPLIPIGRAYNGDGTTATGGAVAEFGFQVHDRGFTGCSWWVMDQAAKLPGIWAALSDTPGFGDVKPVESQLDRIERVTLDNNRMLKELLAL